MTRNELIIKLAVALYYVGRSAELDYTRNLDNWINDADAALTALLALDQQSPPVQEAAPGGEPKERVCVCADRKPAFDSIGSAFVMSTIHHGAPYTGKPFVFCPFCGGKIITEAT